MGKSKAERDAAFLGGTVEVAPIPEITVRDTVKRQDLAGGIGVICRQFKGSVTSWWRSPARNESVGGAASSLHLRGLACDVVYDQMPALVQVQSVAATFGLRVIREDDHDHIEAVVVK